MNFPRSLLKDSALINGTRNESSEIVLGNDIIYIPFIISIAGMIGNFMTIVTILRTDMRKNYANHYILVLLTSDTILLLNLFIRFWVEIDTISFNLCVSARYIWCVAVYVSNFAIISLTMERFFAIVFPLHHMKNSHLNRWKIILAWLIPTLLISFNVLYALKGTTEDDVVIKFSSTKSERIKCTFDYERPHVDIIFHIPRLIFSFILTLIVVISVNLIITGKLKARSVFRSRSTSYQSQRAPRRKAFFKGESSSKETQATSIILAVIPILYVFLNTPFWLRQFLKFFMKNKENLQFINKHYFFTTISYYMFCMNFAINFIVYALISPNFRISFFKVWFCRNDPRLSSSVRFSANATAISRIVSSGSSVMSDNNAAVVIEEASITSGRNSIKEA